MARSLYGPPKPLGPKKDEPEKTKKSTAKSGAQSKDESKTESE